MSLEISKPELERRVREGIQSGRVHDVDELLSKALDALSEKEAAERPLQTAAEIILASMRDVPPEIMATMPTDGASQRDHYIYGWPKRDL